MRNDEEDDDDVIIQDDPITPAAAIPRKKQAKSKTVKPATRLPPPKGVNDALRSFQASFGLAPSSPAPSR